MPTESPAAPPAAPTPPPAAPAAPQAPPPTPGERSQTEWLSDIGNELGDLEAGKPLPARGDGGKFKAADKPPAKAPEKPAEATVAPPPPKEVAKAPEAPPDPPKPVKAADLRTAFEGLKKKVREELEPEVQKLRAKVQEYETKAPEDAGPLLQKLKATEERNAHLEKQMALMDFEQTEDFSKKYDQPYRQMWNKATNAFNQLTVREPAGQDEDGNTTYNRRPATEADLIKLGALPLSELDEAAQAMFGASAPRATKYIEDLRDLAVAKRTAIEEAKTKAGEWKAQRGAEFQQRQKTLATAWTDINKGLEEKYPKAYKVEEGNADDVSSHTKGFALANLLFLGGEALTPAEVDSLPGGFKDTVKAGKPLTEIQKVQLHALARLKMANHDRKVVQLKKAQERIADLEKSLAEYEKTEPPAGKAGAGARTSSKPWDEEVADELKALDR